MAKISKPNPQVFECEQCGNPLMKSRFNPVIKCRYCGYLNQVGVFKGRKKNVI